MVAIIDAEGVVLGRFCTVIAKRLLKGEEIIIINTEKAIVTGNKKMLKARYKHEREVGTYRKGPFFPRMPDQIVKRTVRGMIPYQTSHGRAALKKIKCYIGIPKEFEGKKFEIIKDAKKQPINYMTIENLSKFLGANI